MKRTVALVGLVFTMFAAAAPVASAGDGGGSNCGFWSRLPLFGVPCQ